MLPVTADAHFTLVEPASWLMENRLGDPQKAGPCGGTSADAGMPTMTAGPMQPWTWEIMEVFKVEDGLLHEIEAVLERAPYGMASGWSSWEDGMSDKIQFQGGK